LDCFQKVIGKPQAYCNLGFLLASQGKNDEAKQAYQEALKLEPGLQVARAAITKLNQVEMNRQAAAVSQAKKERSRPTVDDKSRGVVGTQSTSRVSTEEESTAAPIEAAMRRMPAAKTGPTDRSNNGGAPDEETPEPALLNPATMSASSAPIRAGVNARK